LIVVKYPVEGISDKLMPIKDDSKQSGNPVIVGRNKSDRPSGL